MIRAQQPSHHDQQVKRHKSKRHSATLSQHPSLKNEIPKLASRQHAPGIASVADGSFHLGIEVSTTMQLVFDPQAAFRSDMTRPLSNDLAL
jgi:hypothetical protein